MLIQTSRFQQQQDQDEAAPKIEREQALQNGGHHQWARLYLSSVVGGYSLYNCISLRVKTFQRQKRGGQFLACFFYHRGQIILQQLVKILKTPEYFKFIRMFCCTNN